MKAEIIRVTAEGSCEAKTVNGLLVVFRVPGGLALHLSDELEFDNLTLDADVTVFNITQAFSFVVHLAANNVHDLRLPVRHGSSRTPNAERLREE